MSTPQTEPMNSDSAEVARITTTGTVWFAAAMIAAGIPLAGLLSSGWRPAELDGVSAVAFWVGSLLGLAGTAALAWAGCPVLGATVAEADRQKVISIRGGVVLYLAGTVVATLSVLVS